MPKWIQEPRQVYLPGLLSCLAPGERDGMRDVLAGAGNDSRPPEKKTYQPIPDTLTPTIKNPGTLHATRVDVTPQSATFDRRPQLNHLTDKTYAAEYRAGVALGRQVALPSRQQGSGALEGYGRRMDRRTRGIDASIVAREMQHRHNAVHDNNTKG